MSKILTLSGWTQPADALAVLLPVPVHVFDYSDYAPGDSALQALAVYQDVPHIIAWSMGAQLAIMAAARGILNPEKMTLIAPPYQFVQDEDIRKAMDVVTFARFRAQYAGDTQRLKARFHGLIAKNDTNQREVMAQLAHHTRIDDTARWLPWLDYLGQVSLKDEMLSTLPDTQVIHGANDVIVPVEQSGLLRARAPQLVRHVWDDAGHAPHLHDTGRFLQAIRDHHGLSV